MLPVLGERLMTPSETTILEEIHELKTALARVLGTADRPEGERFSTAALDEAAKFYHKMTIERGEWVPEKNLAQYLGTCSYRSGAFIRKEFAFTNWIKKSHSYLYNKQDLIALGHELKTRNINLKRYEEFVDDKAAFEKKAAKTLLAATSAEKNTSTGSTKARLAGTTNPAATTTPGSRKSKAKPFIFPKGVKNITTTDIPKPDPEIVRQHLAQLKAAFKTAKLTTYIDFYKGTHAMLKYIYHFEKYLEPGLKRRCQKWCEDFNYANHALELITGKREVCDGRSGYHRTLIHDG